MKMIYVVLMMFAALTFAGCAKQSSGTFNGRLIDVEWGGRVFDSCELEFQLGEQSSNVSRASTTNREFCERASQFSGQVVKAKYRAKGWTCIFACESEYIIESVEPYTN